MYLGVSPTREIGEFYPPLTTPRSLRRGLSGAQIDQQINSIVSTGAGTTVSILATLGVIGGPVGAAIAGVIAVGSLIAGMLGKGCGQTCIIASNDANKLEPLLQQNLSAYMSSPVHYASLQAAALNNADTVLNALKTACSDPSLGAAGERCISERLVPGACHWKASGGMWQGNTWIPFGQAGSGDTCFNWLAGYRDPIANDPTVVPDPIAQAVPGSGLPASVSSLFPSSVGGLSLSGLMLPFALILGGIVLAEAL